MIILKNDAGDFIYLDVVTQYSRGFSGQVTQHPVDGSGNVSDNVVTQNPRIQLVGNITGADFNSGKPILSPEDRTFIGIDQIVVGSDIATPIEVSYEDNFRTLLPDVIGQFFTDSLPDIENLNEGRDAVYSEKVLFQVLKAFQRGKIKVTLYEFDNNVVSDEPVENLFIVGLNVNETVTTGDSLAFDLTLEQVTISNLLEDELPEDVQQDFVIQNAERVNKGQQSANELNTPINETDTGSFLNFLSVLREGVSEVTPNAN